MESPVPQFFRARLYRRVYSALLILVALRLGWPATLVEAAQFQNTRQAADNAFKVDVGVDPSSLSLNISILLGAYPGRAGMSVPVALKYTSKLWRIDSEINTKVPTTRLLNAFNYSEGRSSGWNTSLQAPQILNSGLNRYDSSGLPIPDDALTPNFLYYVIQRKKLIMPDGSSHELVDPGLLNQLSSGQPYPPEPPFYKTLDGSDITYDTAKKILYLADGSRWLLDFSSGSMKFVDRNGNTHLVNNGVTDTMGRNIPYPPLSTQTGAFNYALPGFQGQNRIFTFTWKTLFNSLTNPASGLRYYGNILSPHSPTPVFSPTLFYNSGGSDFLGGGTYFDRGMLTEIRLPTGASYKFSYNNYGEIDKVVYPGGAFETYVHGPIVPLDEMDFEHARANRGVIQKQLSPSGSGADLLTWTFTTQLIDRNQPLGSYRITTNHPDGSRSTRDVYSSAPLFGGAPAYEFEVRNALIGMPFNERNYSSSGQLLSETTTQWTADNVQSSGVTFYSVAYPRPILKAETIFDPSSGKSLTKHTRFSYTTARNLASTIFYDYSANPTTPGPMLKREETTYLESDPAYANAYLGRLPSLQRVIGPQGLVSETKYFYDEVAPSSCGAAMGWTQPQTAVRGNLTSRSELLNLPTVRSIVTRYQYDACGNQVSSTDPRGMVSQTSYADAFSSGSRSTFAYPTAHSVPDPQGGSQNTSMSYDFATGLPVTSTDVNGQVTTTAYNDPLNRIKSEVRPSGGGSTLYSYGDLPGGLFLSTQTALDGSRFTTKTQVFDAMGRVRSELASDQPGNIFNYVDRTYDVMGRPSGVSNPYFLPSQPQFTTTLYDAFGRPHRIIFPDGSETQVIYSLNEVTTTDAAGKKRRTTSNALGQIVQVTEAPGTASAVSTSYKYDGNGNLTNVNQSGQNRIFVYDSLKRLVSMTTPEGGTTTYVYDDNGNVISKKDARQITTTYAYDILNRLKSSVYSDSTPRADYYYDLQSLPAGAPSFARGFSKGRLVGAVSAGGSNGTYFGYDSVGRVNTKVQRTAGVSYLGSAVYNEAGLVLSEKFPSGRIVTHAYDDAGRALSASSGGSALISSSTYGPQGQISTQILGNGTVVSRTYNNRMQPIFVQYGTPGQLGSLLSLVYGYGGTQNNGNAVSILSVGGGARFEQRFTYDALNRMESATELLGTAQNWKQVFGYDAFGNRQAQTFLGASGTPSPAWPTLTFSPSTNRISDPAYSYDLSGNLTRDPFHNSYVFDANQKLTSIDGTQFFEYDAQNKRVRKIGAIQKLRYIYGIGGELIAEYDDATGALSKEFVAGHTIDASGRINYIMRDVLGSPRVVTNSQGIAESRHDYYPFGEEIRCAGNRTTALGYCTGNLDERFVGKIRDFESGLDFFEARYYSSIQGRFTSLDPSRESGKPENPQTWNRYAYALNSPLTYVDADGKIPILVVLYLLWQAYETYGTAKDGVDMARTLADSKASGADKIMSVGIFALGTQIPGHGADYVRFLKKLQTIYRDSKYLRFLSRFGSAFSDSRAKDLTSAEGMKIVQRAGKQLEKAHGTKLEIMDQDEYRKLVGDDHDAGFFDEVNNRILLSDELVHSPEFLIETARHEMGAVSICKALGCKKSELPRVMIQGTPRGRWSTHLLDLIGSLNGSIDPWLR